VLATAGRCAEAREAFEQYATFVEQDDQPSANMARRYAAQCTPRPTPMTTAPMPKG
jgi:Flp pilus assembly protein TadD